MEEKEEVDEFLKFMEVAMSVPEKPDTVYEFECPICKEKARASISGYNGHLWAECKKCQLKMVE